MAAPSPEEILSVKSDHIADFIQRHSHARTLSSIVKRLNRDLIEGDETASFMASRALEHLGFRD
jgi:hypothetical protein